MIKDINISDKEKAILNISNYCKKEYESVDIRFLNVHLKRLNSLCHKKIFDKNDLYIRSSTLWELTQPEGKSGKHHFHGLSAESIFYVLKGIITPYCIYEPYGNRYVVSTVYKNEKEENFVIVIEIKASLTNNRYANVNKIVSIYPKRNLDNIINNLDRKQMLFNRQ